MGCPLHTSSTCLHYHQALLACMPQAATVVCWLCVWANLQHHSTRVTRYLIMWGGVSSTLRTLSHSLILDPRKCFSDKLYRCRVPTDRPAKLPISLALFFLFGLCLAFLYTREDAWWWMNWRWCLAPANITPGMWVGQLCEYSNYRRGKEDRAREVLSKEGSQTSQISGTMNSLSLNSVRH